jgi:hypothetical protein
MLQATAEGAVSAIVCKAAKVVKKVSGARSCEARSALRKARRKLIVLGTTRLDSYYRDTGESRWWMPVGTVGSPR